MLDLQIKIVYTFQKLILILKGGVFMAIMLSDLIEESKNKFKLELLAGEDGVQNLVHWVQFTEDLDTINFFKGGELIITTGMSAKSSDWLFHFISNLIKQNTSGLILNTGYYIFQDSIPEDVYALCNEHHFPLFSMPWEIHLSDIMQDYCNKIFAHSYQEDKTNMAFNSLVFHPENSSSSLEILSSLGYDNSSSYTITITRNTCNISKLSLLLRKTDIKFYIFKHEDYLIIILSDCQTDILSNLVSTIQSSNSFTDFHFGIGICVPNLSLIHKSYESAQFALNIAEKSDKFCINFEELGVLKLLFSCKDKAILLDIYKKSIGALEDFDSQHKADLTNTLRLYLENDGSIQAVADGAFTHRNTINYRMKKIRSLLNTELTTMEDKFNYQLAFLIKDYLE